MTLLLTTVLKHRNLWLTLGWLQVATIVYLSLTPHPPSGPDIPDFDKIAHSISYATMMYWFCQLYMPTKTRIVIGMGFIAMGVGIEFIQGWSGFRMFEYWDMAANSLGVVIGAGLAVAIRVNLLVFLEARFRR